MSHPLAGCDTVQFIDITQSPEVPIIQIDVPDTLTCRNDEIEIIGENSSSGANILYEWTGPGIVSSPENSNIMVNAPGMYTLTLRDTANGCEISAGIDVVADRIPPQAVAMAVSKIDCSTDEVTVSGAGSAVGLYISYVWSSPDSGNIVGSTMTRDIMVNAPGTYELSVTNERNGCSSIDTTVVHYDENIIRALDLQIIQPACEGEEDGSIHIAGVIGGVPDFEYSFDGGVTFSGESNADHLLPGKYIVAVRDQNGCELMDTVELFSPTDFIVNLGEDMIVPLGEEVFLIAETDLPDSLRSNIIWSPFFDSLTSNILEQRFTPPIGHYQIAFSLANLNDCFETDEINVFVVLEERIYIPTAIRPLSVASGKPPGLYLCRSDYGAFHF